MNYEIYIMLELYTYIMSLELYTMNRLNIFLDPYVDLFHQLYRKIFSLHKSKCTFNCQLPQMKIYTSAWSEGMLNEWWIFSMNILVDSIKTFVFLQTCLCWIDRETACDMKADFKILSIESVKRKVYVTLRHISYFLYAEIGF